MNYKLTIVVALSFFAYVRLATAAAPAAQLQESNVHEINQKLQELKKKYDDLGKKVSQEENKVAELMAKNQNDPQLTEAVLKSDNGFEEIKKLTLEKFALQNKQDSKSTRDSIGKLSIRIEAWYKMIAFAAAYYLQDIISLIDAKIQLHKDMMAKDELARKIKRIIGDYKRKPYFESDSNKGAEGEDYASQTDNQYSALKLEISFFGQ